MKDSVEEVALPSRKNVTSRFWLVRMRVLGKTWERGEKEQGLPPKLFPKQRSGEHGLLAKLRLSNRLQASRLAEYNALEPFEP